jgi:hypothetical protein
VRFKLLFPYLAPFLVLVAPALAQADRLICQTDASGRAALYNLDRAKFIDPFYAKSLDDCNRTLAASWAGLTCASNSDGRTAIYDVLGDRFVDQYYSKSLDECLQAISQSPGPAPQPQPNPQPYPQPQPQPQPPCYADRLVCQTDPSGRAAIYNIDRSKFIDRFYAKSLEDCNRTVAASRRGLTCASNSDGRTAIYDVVNDRFVDQYYSKSLDECIQSIR